MQKTRESSVKEGVEHTHLMTNDITKTYISTDISSNINQDYGMILRLI